MLHPRREFRSPHRNVHSENLLTPARGLAIRKGMSMQSMKPILAAMLITCMSTVAMAQGGAGGGAAGAGGAGGSSGGAAAAGAGESGGGGGDLNPHRLGRGADDNPSMPGANPRLGNSAAPPSA